MSSQTERRPYTGTAKKLLAAVDIGTTFTAVSFSILQPGEAPQFYEVRHSLISSREYIEGKGADSAMAKASKSTS
jgi:hypothetical protein